MRQGMMIVCVVALVLTGMMVSSSAQATELEPVLITQAKVDPAPNEGSPFEYCYWRELVSCGSCTYHTDCLIWYGWDNRFGEECMGRRVEYCDGVPTGLEYPVAELRCGC